MMLNNKTKFNRVQTNLEPIYLFKFQFIFAIILVRLTVLVLMFVNVWCGMAAFILKSIRSQPFMVVWSNLKLQSTFGAA